MPSTLAFTSIAQSFLPAYRARYALSPQQASTCQNILQCHTAKLGCLDYACDACARHYPRYPSCRHRHCPQCQQRASARWAEQRMADVLPVTYFHLVFTLPHELNVWAQLHPEVIYHTLFQCAWQTLDSYSRRNRQLQGKLGMTAVSHTWGQNLSQHIHLHCLIPGAALTNDGVWVSTRRDYLYPQRALAKLFRGKMVSALRQAWSSGALHRLNDRTQVDRCLTALMAKDWLIHTKPHLNQAETVVRYLARYAHRTAISPSRIVAVDETSVSFKWKDYRDHQQKIMTLEGGEFLHRFLLHVLPKGLMRIRHYGFLANRVRVARLEQIRASLTTAEAETDSKAAPIYPRPTPERCPACGTGHLRLCAICRPAKVRRQRLQ